jgi:formylglycine-generating enzyme required for sulfatase activity
LSLVTFRDPNAPLVGTVEVWGRRVNASSFEFRHVPYEPGQGTGAIVTRVDLGPGGRLAWTPLRGGVSTFALPADASPVPRWAKVAPEQIAEARKHGVPVAFENDFGMCFVLIPSGTFLMGSPATEQGRDELESQHRVTLTRPYYVQTTEVTNRQFRAFRQAHDSHDQWGRSLNGDEQPAVGISWNDAAAFAVWLSRRDPGRSYRLPTEAEWERACRAGTTTAFWWGDRPSKEKANFYDGEFASGRPSDPGFRVTLPVGSLPANPWGLYEVHGNAREWCSDWYDDSPYEDGAATDPKGPAPSGSHCTRGGAFGEAPYMLRAAWRIGVQGDDEARSYVGFRLVSPLPEPSREDREEPTQDDVRLWLEQDAGGATVGRLLVLWESGHAFRSVRDAHAGTQWQWLGRWTRREEGGVHLLYDWLQVKRKGVVVGSCALDPPVAEALLQDGDGYYTQVLAEGGSQLKWSKRTKDLPVSALMERAPEREFEDPRMRRSPLGDEDPR